MDSKARRRQARAPPSLTPRPPPPARARPRSSDGPPGDPAWRVSPETLQAVLYESYNFFYVNVALAELGLNPAPCVAENPVSEAIFNFVCAWSLMMLPLWGADPRGKRVAARVPLWLGTMALTNVFAPLYMAARLLPEEGGGGAGAREGAGADGASGAALLAAAAAAVARPAPLPKSARAVGAAAAAVGAISRGWAAAARPEYGGLAERWAFAQHAFATDRVFWAFSADAGLYAAWQAWIMRDAGVRDWRAWAPFVGLAAWLLTGEVEGAGGGGDAGRRGA